MRHVAGLHSSGGGRQFRMEAGRRCSAHGRPPRSPTIGQAPRVRSAPTVLVVVVMRGCRARTRAGLPHSAIFNAVKMPGEAVTEAVTDLRPSVFQSDGRPSTRRVIVANHVSFVARASRRVNTKSTPSGSFLAPTRGKSSSAPSRDLLDSDAEREDPKLGGARGIL
jgi:hypothetical protein